MKLIADVFVLLVCGLVKVRDLKVYLADTYSKHLILKRTSLSTLSNSCIYRSLNFLFLSITQRHLIENHLTLNYIIVTFISLVNW